MKIVLEGELHVTEKASGTSIVAKVGDVLNISSGADLLFNSTEKARVFVSVGKRASTPLSSAC
jgi:ethanolamine utilization protein EutQ (cupin superfamily)